jgi:hypothetical protein
MHKKPKTAKNGFGKVKRAFLQHRKDLKKTPYGLKQNTLCFESKHQGVWTKIPRCLE